MNHYSLHVKVRIGRFCKCKSYWWGKMRDEGFEFITKCMVMLSER